MAGGSSYPPSGHFDVSNSAPNPPTKEHLRHSRNNSSSFNSVLPSSLLSAADIEAGIQEIVNRTTPGNDPDTAVDLRSSQLWPSETIPNLDYAAEENMGYSSSGLMDLFGDENFSAAQSSDDDIWSLPGPAVQKGEQPENTVDTIPPTHESSHRSVTASLAPYEDCDTNAAQSSHDLEDGHGFQEQINPSTVLDPSAQLSYDNGIPDIDFGDIGFDGLMDSNDPVAVNSPAIGDSHIVNQTDIGHGGYQGGRDLSVMFPSMKPLGDLPMRCFNCGHKGHDGLDRPSCPTGRLMRYIVSKGKHEYATLHKTDGILRYVNDRHMMIDGMTYMAFGLQDTDCEESMFLLMKAGTLLMRAIFRLLKDVKPGNYIKPTDPDHPMEKMGLQEPVHPLTAKFFGLTVQGSETPISFDGWINCFEVDILAFDEYNRSGAEELTEAYVSYMNALENRRLCRARGTQVGEDGSDFSPVQNDTRVFTTSSSPIQPVPAEPIKSRRGIDTSIYENVNTEVIGGRPNVRCSTCIMKGHTLTATKTCPVGMLDRALHCSSARTKNQWASLKPKAEKACKQLEGVISLLQHFPHEKARLQKKIAEYRALDPATGRPMQAPMKGYALKVARLDAIRALQENPDPLANLPLADYSPKQIEEYKFPDLPGLNVAHPFPQLDWETLWQPGIPEALTVRSVCELDNIGDRPDVQCLSCLHYGHDSRSKSCLVQIVRHVFLNPTAHGISKAKIILDTQLRQAFYWQNIVPEHLRKDTVIIVEVFQEYFDLKHAHEAKQMEIISGRSVKRRKVNHAASIKEASNAPVVGGSSMSRSPPLQTQQLFQTNSFVPLEPSFQTQYMAQPTQCHPLPVQFSSPVQQFATPQSMSPMATGDTPLQADGGQQPSRGTLLDHTKLRGDQFSRLFPFVINDGNNYGGLLVDFTIMPVSLVMEFMPCILNTTS